MRKLIILSIGLVFKLAILMVYGPFSSQDTADYTSIAQAILSDPGFFTKVPDWSTSALPLFAFRPIGYPAAIAIAQLVAGSEYRYLLVALQIALSVYVAATLFDVTALLTKSTRWASLATILYFLSGTSLWDNDILCDSLYACLFNIVVLRLILVLLRHEKPTARPLAALGFLWAFSILLRDNGLYFTVLPMLILLVRSRIESIPTRTRVKHLLTFILPVLLVVCSCASWNFYRTGSAFISMTSVANFLHPAFDIERFHYADPFDGNSVLDRTVKSTMHSYDYTEQPGLLQNAHDALHLTSPTQLQNIVFAKFVDTIVRFPVAYTRYVFDNLNPITMGAALFDPLFNYNEFFQLGAPPRQRVIPGFGLKTLRALSRAHEHTAFLVVLLAALLQAASGALFLLTLFGVPYFFLDDARRGQPFSRERIASGLLLATFVAVAGLFALIHLEVRYLLVVVPEGLAAATFLGHSLATRRFAPSHDIRLETPPSARRRRP